MREVGGFFPINCFRFDSVFGATVDPALAHMQRFCVQSWTQKKPAGLTQQVQWDVLINDLNSVRLES
jgi:hypothetical protein